MEPRPYIKSVEFKNESEIDWSSYPYSIPAVNCLNKILFHSDVTFFVGENGSGKSTILEAIALALGFSEEGGTKNVRLDTANTASCLSANLKLVKSFKKPKDGYFLRAESFYNVASYMDEVGYLDGYGGKSIHARSHGEAFMSLLTDKFKGNGLYLLDEPEAALSPARLLAAISAINGLVKEESQFIIATHSPILLAYPNAKILQFSEVGVEEVEYEETDHYIISKDFLNNHRMRIMQLIED
ncbi:MAG: putative ATPase [Idiomarinaceae bacterium HL-53]|nr:MAG: putative ATPase [Idiomarinaceae bacterium HL-53]CUS47547.1 Predicted ATPase [Idiomarinaceae bacterium HL-53]